MKLNQLGHNEDGEQIIFRKSRKRLGRGMAAGQGKHAGKGMKGQNSRTSGGVRLGFEGGQTTLFRRLPKRGFTNFTTKDYVLVNLDILNQFSANSVITPEFLHENKVITNTQLTEVKKGKLGIKVLGNGEVSKKLTVKANKFTASAVEKINAVGGNVEVI